MSKHEKDKPAPVKVRSIADSSLLVVNTGSTNKKDLLQRIKKLGLKKFVILNFTIPSWANEYPDEWIIADTNDHESAIQAVIAYHKKNPLDGVLTFWEDDVLLTSKITDALHLVGIPYNVASRVRNKHKFREFCMEHGLPSPHHVLTSSIKHLNTCTQLQFPVVIKPTFGANSSFVVKAETLDELKTIYKFVRENISPSIESSLHDGVDLMVEEYIDGDEVDIDILLQNGEIKFWSITDDYQTQEPFFLDNGQAVPSDLPEKAQHELLNLAEIVLEKLEIMNGCIHFEAKYTKSGPVPLEVNLRIGGGVYSFIKNVWHVDMIKHAVCIACGIYFPKIEKSSMPYKYLAIDVLTPEKSGIIASLHIPKEFKKKYLVEDLYIYKEVGDGIFVPPVGYEYLGWLSVSGSNSIDARENLERATKKIHYEIIPFSEDSSLGKTQRKTLNSPAVINKNLLQSVGKQKKIIQLLNTHQKNLNIGIACNVYSQEDNLVEQELTSVGTTIQNVLSSRGYNTFFIDFNNLPRAIQDLQNKKVDLVFNVCERINDQSNLEPHAAALFDVFQIPYTGSNPFTLSSCIDKIRVKKILSYHQIPTPKWDYSYTIDDIEVEHMEYPMIVKPAKSDNSIGISNNSVVINKKQLIEQVEYVVKTLKQPALIEEYLDGDEYDIPIIGSKYENLQVLPLMRSIFSNYPDGMWHIFHFDAKFVNPTKYRKEYLTIQNPPKNVNKKLISLITEIALDSYNLLGCHDYGRVEVKLDSHGNPHVLEINPNPSINIGDALPKSAGLIGLEYGDFIEKIISLAIERYRKKL